jgi:hypothetical protein
MKLALKILGIILVIFIAFASYKKYQKDKERELIESIMDEYFQKEKSEQKKSKTDCERTISFDGNNLCFPKIDKWKECRTDENLENDINNLELNNKILSYYIPTEFYEKSKSEKIVNYPIISLFVHNNTIGMETNKDALPMFFAGLKNSFKVQDFKSVEELLKTKTNAEFIKPILFDNYEILNNAKTCVTINSSKLNGKVINRISFINVLDLKKRIMVLYYSKEIGNDFQFSKMKLENEQIVKKITEVN